MSQEPFNEHFDEQPSGHTDDNVLVLVALVAIAAFILLLAGSIAS